MPTLTITKSYADSTVLTETQLDELKDSIETFINSTKLGSDNLQSSSVTSDQLSTTSVTTAKIANSAVTDAKLASSASADADRAVGTNHIKNNAVTSDKIADLAVTKAKLAALGQQVSSSCGTFTTSSSSPVNITNLSVSVTTTGRPVKVEMVPSGSGVSALSGTQTALASMLISSTGGDAPFIQFNITAGTNMLFPGLFYTDTTITGTPGTYTYTAQAGVSTGTLTVLNYKLIAYEL